MTEQGTWISLSINQFSLQNESPLHNDRTGALKFHCQYTNFHQFSLQNESPLQNEGTGALNYTEKSLLNKPLQNQYSAKIILKLPWENLLYKMKNLLSYLQSASITSTFWSLKAAPSPLHFVEETGGGMVNISYMEHMGYVHLILKLGWEAQSPPNP